ncbi:Zn-dependent hydrolase [Alicyclobacillus dauci]|uniref:Zn-dependent hydrolase n=1 Tax=Alicyclobacillus dauci TaxID=1475485 RepID=A0ABY6Z5N8_9BACL|nr:Zn-dependent hydrolase [Alicyclobacillus dauci]WAH38079.1 Zn-dependent hydrolase [Alicyclobacillus dauci]
MTNQDRLWSRLLELGQIGVQPTGGITRLSFSKEERQAKDLVASYMQEAGMVVHEDAVGNLIGRKEGKDPSAPIVLTGSHVDSVYSGGNFDGPLGVLSAVEAVQTMTESGTVTQRPIEVVAFTDEEGARFRFGMIGSRGIAGTLTVSELDAKDAEGVTIAEAMHRVGLDPTKISEAARPTGSVHAYIEVHIEQGKILESADLSVGVVSGIAGPLWLKFTVSGQAGHAGTSPMNMRRDALAGAVAIMQVIEEETKRRTHTVGTVGQLTVQPGGVNIIPGVVEFTLDLRDVDLDTRNEVESIIRRRATEICSERSLGLVVEELQNIPPVVCSAAIHQATFEACEEAGFKTMELVSGAGHDGMQLQALCPVGMIFVRSQDGISHHPDEWSSPEDCAAGAEVLYHTLLKLASETP